MRSLLLTLLIPILCWSADQPSMLSVPPPEPASWSTIVGKVNEYRVVNLKLDTKAKTIDWTLVDDQKAFLNAKPNTDEGALTVPDDGAYRILVVVDGTVCRYSVQVGKIPPFPPPPPGPGPQPDPVPGGKIARFAVVEETSKAGAWRGDLLGSPKIRTMYLQLAAGHGTIHRLIDITEDGGDDPLAKKFRGLAAGKELPWFFGCDEKWEVLKSVACPKEEDPFIALFDLHVGARKMGLLPDKPKMKWKVFGETPEVPLIPRDQWKPMNMGVFCPPVHDQDGIGECASSAATGLLEACRNQAGLGYVKLSAGDLYSRVNGGRDNGSMLEDNLDEIMKNGVSTAASVPYVWNGRKNSSAAVVAERKNYMAVEVYQCKSFDAMASAVQQGFFVEHGMMWRDDFAVDSEGWLTTRNRGGSGGHARFAYGLAKRGNVWGLVTQNSWNTSWGGSKDGTVKVGSDITAESFFGEEIGGYFAVRAVKQYDINPFKPSMLKLNP